MADKKLLFLTGRLAEPRLAETVAAMGLPNGSWRIANLGIKVAALMTENIVRNRLKEPLEADRVIVPGRSRMNLGHLGRALRRAVRARAGRDHRPAAVFWPRRQAAGPVEAGHPHLCRDRRCAGLHRRAAGGARPRAIAKGGDVVDIGCQPDVHFPHLEETVAALKREGFKVSVDSGNVDELTPRRTGRRRLRAQPRRIEPRCHRRHQLRADPAAATARRSRLAAARHRHVCGEGYPASSPIRCSIQSTSAS